ncbi:outer membrane protein [Novimethylophilus kurashikiensis]|uniref:Outer membrane protein n=1 Tax=Novimethylophilus kurashikiensis TaxID=1825523 RepID=A0A2R5F599_9PROT|nr:OmpH family outer membrane protein [Novimethylophilus kurashikiensis]GBG13109.1 outer membrane protein [Novimethylophilus kurashikiensis]
MNQFLKTLLAASLALSVFSATAADMKVGFVNVDRLLKNAPQTAEVGKKLEKEFSPRAAELDRLKKQISDQETAGKDASSLRLDFERKQRELNEDINIRKSEELATLQDRINKTINTIAESEGYDLVVYSGIVYANKRTDITDKVLKSLGAAPSSK